MSSLSEITTAWSGWVFPATWQLALLASLIALIALLTRRLSARLRHALWILVTIKVFLPPSLGIFWGVGNWGLQPMWNQAERLLRESSLSEMSPAAQEALAVVEGAGHVIPVESGARPWTLMSPPARLPPSPTRGRPPARLQCRRLLPPLAGRSSRRRREGPGA